MAEDTWLVVGRKGRHRAAAAAQGGGEAAPAPLEAAEHEVASCATLEQLRASLERLEADLAASPFCTSLRHAFAAVAAGDAAYWRRITRVRCYGLGPPSSSLSARAQLALLPVLLSLLPGAPSAAFYDPVLSDLDKQLIAAAGGTLLTEAAAADHRVTESTLFYMPHCDASVYNDVLDANWAAESLPELAILGNSFEHMQERWSGPTFRRRTGRPHRVLALTDLGLVREEALRGSGFRVENAFNDTSLHVFEGEALRQAPDAFLA